MGLYYLQSRYYNPTLGRFLNADALVSTGQGVLGNNMFAYCASNPVFYKDPSGFLRLRTDCVLVNFNDGGGGKETLASHINRSIPNKVKENAQKIYAPAVSMQPASTEKSQGIRRKRVP